MKKLPLKLDNKKTTLTIIVGLVILVFILIYLLVSRPTPAEQQAKELKHVSKEVSQLMILPDEEPTLATIEDVTLLTGQQFFLDSQNGDKLLIYPQAAKAILYRPEIGKIINVGPLIYDESNTAISENKKNVNDATQVTNDSESGDASNDETESSNQTNNESE